VTLPQLLHLENGDDMAKKISADESRLTALLKQNDDKKLIDELFFATMSRAPRVDELAAIQQTLAAGDAREEVYRDLFWALLNSKEFAFNH
jgi:hypothetical protein